jgi:cytidine deaminase
LANAAGDYNVQAVAVVGFNFTGPEGASQVVAPCGSCRQLMAEAAQLAGTELRVLCCNVELTTITVSTISELLPGAFGPRDLGLDREWPRLRERLQTRVGQLIALRRKR